MADILVYNAFSKSNNSLRYELGEPTLDVILANPNCYCVWPTIIPSLDTSNSLCVYDSASGYFRCGNCCLWTVPANTTKVRFELWGAGAGTGIGMCCSGSPFGATGAYASTIIDAVPGCQYTLCAGCAHAQQLYCVCDTDVSGCKSYVTGYGLSNFCADGGCSSLGRMMYMIHGTSCCRYQARCSTTAGGCICCGNGNTYFCFSNSCNISCCFTTSCTCCINRVFDSDRKGYGTSYQIPSMYSADWFDTNFYGCACDQPTMLPSGTVSSICCIGYTSDTCCGASWGGACAGNRCQPGKGGSFTHIMGGNTGGYGDWGRTGMVKVSWC